LGQTTLTQHLETISTTHLYFDNKFTQNSNTKWKHYNKWLFSLQFGLCWENTSTRKISREYSLPSQSLS